MPNDWSERANVVPPVDPRGGTDALPGSARKLEVMRGRVSRGFQPHHPDDAGVPKTADLTVVNLCGDFPDRDPADMMAGDGHRTGARSEGRQNKRLKLDGPRIGNPHRARGVFGVRDSVNVDKRYDGGGAED